MWVTLDSAVLLQNNYFSWEPAGYGLAQVRVQIGAETFVSDTFLIASPTQIKVGFDCPDSTFLYWGSAAPGAGYQVWGLGERYLEPLFVTNDSSWVFSKVEYPQMRFAVSPVEHGIYGMRSAAPDPDQQGAGCYVSVFFAELVPEQGVVQTGLQLGTFYNAQSVALEKEKNGVFNTLFTENADRLHFEWADLNPDAGINRYRAKVLLHDGRAIYSDIIPVYVGGTNGIRIFPNPFTSNGILHVVVNSPGENALFQLFDIAGREIWSSLLTEIHTPVQLPEMQAGTYFWRIGEARGKLAATRTN
ncbi:MAG: T9SS type A sorting domain-containing protein [Lewinellaceae bacterium]|nr:T9SS type A sorting domain-containing protein [Lewinellaceae bacterium]